MRLVAVVPTHTIADGEYDGSGAELAVTGRLVVQPYLWATDGMLWPLVPDGVRMWTVEGIQRVGDDGGTEHLATLTGPTDLGHGATYLVEVVSA